VVIPQLENTISYIIRELDEQEREEFFRLKKVRDLVVQSRDAEEENKKAPENDGKDEPNMLDQFKSDDDLIVDVLN